MIAVHIGATKLAGLRIVIDVEDKRFGGFFVELLVVVVQFVLNYVLPFLIL